MIWSPTGPHFLLLMLPSLCYWSLMLFSWLRSWKGLKLYVRKERSLLLGWVISGKDIHYRLGIMQRLSDLFLITTPRKETLLSLLCRVGNWDLERLYDLPKVTQLKKGRDTPSSGIPVLSTSLQILPQWSKRRWRRSVTPSMQGLRDSRRGRAIALFLIGAILGLAS